MEEDGRWAVRHGITAQVKLRRIMEPSGTSSVADLSLTGFRIRTHMKLSSGSEISLTLPGLEALGEGCLGSGVRGRMQLPRATARSSTRRSYPASDTTLISKELG